MLPLRFSRSREEPRSAQRTEHDLVPGQEYAVFGLGFWEGRAWVEIESDGGFLYSVPLSEFEIVDATPSSLWRIRAQPDGAITLWPPEFYEPYFHSDLADRKPEAVDAFKSVRERLNRK